MKTAGYRIMTVTFLATALFLGSCSRKEEQQPGAQQKTAGEKTISYIDEDVVFGLYFDGDGTQRTLTLAPGQKEFDIYLFLECPEHMEVAAVEWRIAAPEGIQLVNDRYRQDRILSMGAIDKGHSERFSPCLLGPKVLLHTLTYAAAGDLQNAVFSVMPSLDNENLGVAECKEGYPLVRAAAYKAVVNPAE